MTVTLRAMNTLRIMCIGQVVMEKASQKSQMCLEN